MKTSTINYITEQINESNFIELYNKTKEETNNGKYALNCGLFVEEVTGLFDAIADEIKSDIGLDIEGYENDDFDYNIGNGQISCYMFITLNNNDFEIRLSDHEDKHYSGNRILRNINENSVKKNLIESIIKEVNKL